MEEGDPDLPSSPGNQRPMLVPATGNVGVLPHCLVGEPRPGEGMTQGAAEGTWDLRLRLILPLPGRPTLSQPSDPMGS